MLIKGVFNMHETWRRYQECFSASGAIFQLCTFSQEARQAPIFHKATLTIVSSINIDVMEVCVLFSPRSDLTLRSVEKANKAILGAIAAAGEDSALTSLLGFHTAGDHEER